MKILLLGNGGRESALAWKISQSVQVDKLYIAPGNGGTGQYGENVSLNPLDFKAIDNFVKSNAIDMIVVGNEDPLVAGIRDYFSGSEVLIVGAGKDGALLEGSKDFAKRFMFRHNIPTAAYKSFTLETIEQGFEFLRTLTPPYVLKADGLAAGKGVVIIDNLSEAEKTLKEMLEGQFGDSSRTVVIEQFLKGVECSVFVLTDGKGNYVTLPVAKDYKRAGDGDTGLNTGGMGAVSPVPFANGTFMDKVRCRIIEPTLNGLIADGIDYRGFIFFGLINVEGEPMVIEYNARMGDPETEAVMPLIKSDLVELMKCAASGDMKGKDIELSNLASTVVIAVSKGYPGHYEKNKIISLPRHIPENMEIFQAGTKIEDGELRTSGGRVLAVCAQNKEAALALQDCYRLIKEIHFDGITYRHDIGKDILS